VFRTVVVDMIYRQKLKSRFITPTFALAFSAIASDHTLFLIDPKPFVYLTVLLPMQLTQAFTEQCWIGALTT